MGKQTGIVELTDEQMNRTDFVGPLERFVQQRTWVEIISLYNKLYTVQGGSLTRRRTTIWYTKQ